jgi:hypothetical protein
MKEYNIVYLRIQGEKIGQMMILNIYITFVITAIIKKKRKHSFEVTTSGEIKVIEVECRKN